MEYEKRQYQDDCVDGWVTHLTAGYDPVIAVPTGGGKTVILCKMLLKWFEIHPDAKVLVMSHTQEILKQDYDALAEFFPSWGLGIYSAGLERRDVSMITIAGIQSAYKHPDLFKDTTLIVVDEVHAINHNSTGMYRTLIEYVGCQVTGMSATIFRMGHGYIHKGKGALFNALAYDLTSIKNFNNLVRDGYLTKLISKTTEMEMDSSNVKKSAGDYNLKDLAKTHDRSSITDTAVLETIKYGKNYRKWLVFAIDIEHADHITKSLKRHNISAESLHSRMDDERDVVLGRFRYGSTRALVSVGMVTTGFDVPSIDLIVLLRPTLSSVLHVQMCGRGLRVADGKDHCLVLDFAGNTINLGPINNPVIPKKKKKGDGEGEAPAKTCPKCKAIMFAMARYCDVCGYEFQFSTKLKANPDGTDIVQKDGPIWRAVQAVSYNIHSKMGKPDSLKVTYVCGMNTFTEWVCLDHNGYAKLKADNWVHFRDPACKVFTTHHVHSRRDFLKVPKEILVDSTGKYPSIKKTRF